MADVAEVVGRNAADVHADLALHPRMEGLLRLVIELKSFSCCGGVGPAMGGRLERGGGAKPSVLVVAATADGTGVERRRDFAAGPLCIFVCAGCPDEQWAMLGILQKI